MKKKKQSVYERTVQVRAVAKKKFQAKVERLRRSVNALVDDVMRDRESDTRVLNPDGKAMSFLIAAQGNLLHLSRWS